MTDPASHPRPRILVVDDEVQMGRLLTVALESGGYHVTVETRGKEALVLAAQQPPALILLDLGLPDLPGQEVLRRLREWSKVPVIVLTALDAESEKVAALDSGADDYVTKPFHLGELLARVRAALRHAAKDEVSPVYQRGEVVVDLSSRRVTVQGREVALTVTEYSLLRLFVRHAGKVLTHRFLLREVWGPGAEQQTHYLRVYLARLREKLEPKSAAQELFLTEPGVGYRLVEPGN